MKVLNCPQCGGMIKSISKGQEFVVCDYCSAKLFIPKEIIFEIPDEKPSNENIVKKGNAIIWKSPLANENE